MQGPKAEKQLAYWRQQLAGAPATLDLPTDRPRPAVQSFNGAKISISLPAPLIAEVKSYARDQGATMYMTLLAAFQGLLARYSNQDDVVIGSPIANRNRAEVEEMIGFFANTLVLRTKLAPDATFNSVVGHVKETTLGAYENQDLPFEKLVEELQPERN